MSRAPRCVPTFTVTQSASDPTSFRLTAFDLDFAAHDFSSATLPSRRAAAREELEFIVISKVHGVSAPRAMAMAHAPERTTGSFRLRSAMRARVREQLSRRLERGMARPNYQWSAPISDAIRRMCLEAGRRHFPARRFSGCQPLSVISSYPVSGLKRLAAFSASVSVMRDAHLADYIRVLNLACGVGNGAVHGPSHAYVSDHRSSPVQSAQEPLKRAAPPRTA